MPFPGAMPTGWIMPIAAEARMTTSVGGRQAETGRDFDHPIASGNGAHHVKGSRRGDRRPGTFHCFRANVRDGEEITCMIGRDSQIVPRKTSPGGDAAVTPESSRFPS